MEALIRSTAPTSKLDFLVKLFIAVLVAGMLNHLRDFATYEAELRSSFGRSLSEACFTAIPMCAFALFLLGHLHKLQCRLYIQSITDPLTQLRNRRWFLDKATRMPTSDLTLLMVDLDHFKNVNDSYGHDAGDACLQAMAQHLRSCLRSGDICARIGGEEFAVILSGADRDQVQDIAAHICHGAAFQPRAGASLHVTASVGIALAGGTIPLSLAMHQADIALYQAKENGRSCYVWSAETSTAAKPSLALVRQTALSAALLK